MQKIWPGFCFVNQRRWHTYLLDGWQFYKSSALNNIKLGFISLFLQRDLCTLTKCVYIHVVTQMYGFLNSKTDALWLMYTRLDLHLLTWQSGFCLKQNPRLVISIACAFMVVSTLGESMLPHRSPLWCRFLRLNQDSRSQMMCKMCARSCSDVLRIIQDLS